MLLAVVSNPWELARIFTPKINPDRATFSQAQTSKKKSSEKVNPERIKKQKRKKTKNMTYLEPGVAVTPGICQHLPAAKVVVTWAIAFQQEIGN